MTSMKTSQKQSRQTVIWKITSLTTEGATNTNTKNLYETQILTYLGGVIIEVGVGIIESAYFKQCIMYT